jgi:hypothetical protein
MAGMRLRDKPPSAPDSPRLPLGITEREPYSAIDRFLSAHGSFHFGAPDYANGWGLLFCLA